MEIVIVIGMRLPWDKRMTVVDYTRPFAKGRWTRRYRVLCVFQDSDPEPHPYMIWNVDEEGKVSGDGCYEHLYEAIEDL